MRLNQLERNEVYRELGAFGADAQALTRAPYQRIRVSSKRGENKLGDIFSPENFNTDSIGRVLAMAPGVLAERFKPLSALRAVDSSLSEQRTDLFLRRNKIKRFKQVFEHVLDTIYETCKKSRTLMKKYFLGDYGPGLPAHQKFYQDYKDQAKVLHKYANELKKYRKHFIDEILSDIFYYRNMSNEFGNTGIENFRAEMFESLKDLRNYIFITYLKDDAPINLKYEKQGSEEDQEEYNNYLDYIIDFIQEYRAYFRNPDLENLILANAGNLIVRILERVFNEDPEHPEKAIYEEDAYDIFFMLAKAIDEQPKLKTREEQREANEAWRKRCLRENKGLLESFPKTPDDVIAYLEENLDEPKTQTP